jgi:hypothetical protein
MNYSGPNVVTVGKKVDHLNQLSTLEQQFDILQELEMTKMFIQMQLTMIVITDIYTVLTCV